MLILNNLSSDLTRLVLKWKMKPADTPQVLFLLQDQIMKPGTVHDLTAEGNWAALVGTISKGYSQGNFSKFCH